MSINYLLIIKYKQLRTSSTTYYSFYITNVNNRYTLQNGTIANESNDTCEDPLNDRKMGITYRYSA